ncbi:MAG: hypothetical protein FGM39_02500 [Phycisphaerales bacterium]|nr:hypothetical protein [Phycisphaerales bacterium]
MSTFGAVPPTGPVPGAPFQSEETLRWPGLIGGLSIAFGIITLLGSCCGGVGAALMPLALGAAGLKVGPMPGSILAWMVFDVVASLALGYMLFAGGLGVLRRRAGGPRMLLRYAAVRLVLVVPMLVVGILLVPASAKWSAQFMEAQYAAQEESGQPVTEDQEAALEAARTPTALNYVMTAIGPFLGCAYPIILLVWLRRPHVRATWESWDA